jgi:hypothetical protein
MRKNKLITWFEQLAEENASSGAGFLEAATGIQKALMAAHKELFEDGSERF